MRKKRVTQVVVEVWSKGYVFVKVARERDRIYGGDHRWYSEAELKDAQRLLRRGRAMQDALAKRAEKMQS